MMEKKISVISIIVKDAEASTAVNELLHEFREYVIGRMGIPYHDRGISIICIVLDATGDITSSLSGKLGMIKDVKTKTVVSKQENKKEG
jgi:putative iron-only hydrogenase system regulator